MPKLEIKTGKGLKFDNNGVMLLDISDADGIEIKFDSNDALIIPDLTGPDGPAAGSDIDNITVIHTDATEQYLQTNPAVIQYIFSIVGYETIQFPEVKDGGFNADEYIVDTSIIRNVESIKNELNKNIDACNGVSSVSYVWGKGNFVMLRYQTRPGALPKWTYALDNGNRYYDDILMALFVIDDIIYNKGDNKTLPGYSDYYIRYLKLKCLWAREEDKVKAVYQQGGIYESLRK